MAFWRAGSALTTVINEEINWGARRPRSSSNRFRIPSPSKIAFIIAVTLFCCRLAGALADFYITDRRYIGFETETGYHHYAIDVAQIYELEE